MTAIEKHMQSQKTNATTEILTHTQKTQIEEYVTFYVTSLLSFVLREKIT